MKARNRGIFQDMTVKRIPIPDKYQVKQPDHDDYIWQTQDDRFVKVVDMNGSHLHNVYRMLVNTILYARELDKHRALTSPMRKLITQCSFHLHYIGYELHVRQEMPSIDYNKYKMVDDGET